jgi:hypothetical protein
MTSAPLSHRTVTERKLEEEPELTGWRGKLDAGNLSCEKTGLEILIIKLNILSFYQRKFLLTLNKQLLN